MKKKNTHIFSLHQEDNFHFSSKTNKIIAPTISLHSGKIVYDYYLNLDGHCRRRYKSVDERGRGGRVNSSIHTHVNPTRGIMLRWTDNIVGGGDGGDSSRAFDLQMSTPPVNDVICF